MRVMRGLVMPQVSDVRLFPRVKTPEEEHIKLAVMDNVTSEV